MDYKAVCVPFVEYAHIYYATELGLTSMVLLVQKSPVHILEGGFAVPYPPYHISPINQAEPRIPKRISSCDAGVQGLKLYALIRSSIDSQRHINVQARKTRSSFLVATTYLIAALAFYRRMSTVMV